jgi:large subunit ribosomal protein L4
VNRDVLRQSVVAYEANQRAGTAKAQTRGEVTSSNVKMRGQKHTGRARAGARSNPLWRGGGVIHGPRPRDYSQKLNRKMRRIALRSALLAKMRDGEVKVLERLEFGEPKTREMVRILRRMNVERSFLLVLAEPSDAVWRSARNIPGSAVLTGRELNPYQVVRAQQVIFTRDALDAVLASLVASAEEPGQEPAEAPDGQAETPTVEGQ